MHIQMVACSECGTRRCPHCPIVKIKVRLPGPEAAEPAVYEGEDDAESAARGGENRFPRPDWGMCSS
jgi:hypothetical protein